MNRLEKHPRLLLTLAALLYLLPGIGQFPLMDRDEPRFSRATVEMAERGDWIVPYFNNEYRFDKPPLTYWWMRLHYRLFGVTEMAARLHSVVAAWLVGLLVYGLARRFDLPVRWSLLAGLVWLTCLQVWIHGRFAVADAPLILGLVLSLRALFEYLFSVQPLPRYGRWFWCLYLGIALGFLAKGPLAFLIPLLSLALFYLLGGSGQWKHPQSRALLNSLAPGTALVLALVGLWGIPALVQTGGAYFDVGIGKHVIERGVEPFNDRLFVPGLYYVFAILIFFSPWVAPLWPALRAGWCERKTHAPTWFLVSWAGASLLIFSFYSTQLPHYILPAYPALAILVAGFLFRQTLPRFQLSLWISLIALAALCLAGLTLGSILWGYAVLRSLPLCLILLGLLFGLLLVASVAVKRRRFGMVFAVLALAASLFLPIASSFRGAHITVAAQEAFGLRWQAAEEAIALGFTEPSLVWYSGRAWNFHPQDGIETMDLGAGRVLIFGTRRWRLDEQMVGSWLGGKPIQPMHDRREMLLARFATHQIEYVQGYSPGNGSWVEIALVAGSNAKPAQAEAVSVK